MTCTCKERVHKCAFLECDKHVKKGEHPSRYFSVCDYHYDTLFDLPASTPPTHAAPSVNTHNT